MLSFCRHVRVFACYLITFNIVHGSLAGRLPFIIKTFIILMYCGLVFDVMLHADNFFEHQIVAFPHAEALVNLLCGKVGSVGIQAYL